jgi:hypothetical protein
VVDELSSQVNALRNQLLSVSSSILTLEGFRLTAV